MADATFVQTSFLGGEWGPYAQGRMEKPDYHHAMNLCYNGYPVEAGAWTPRPGFILGGVTRAGKPGVLRDFHFSTTDPYTMEFTNGYLRFWSGVNLALDNAPVGIVSISTADPALMTTVAATSWNTGDEIVLHQDTNVVAPGLTLLFNRTFQVVKNSTTTFYLYDPVTQEGLDGSTLTGATSGIFAARVLAFATSYKGSTSLDSIRVVQSEQTVLILHPAYPPAEVYTDSEQTDTNYATFTFSQTISPGFVDGPYLDPPSPQDGSTLTPSAATGTITLTASATSWINGGVGFLSTDVGRLMRFLSEPATWNSGTSYAVGANVKYAGSYWTAQVAQSDNIPGADAVNWFINPYGAAWTWGTIATVIGSTSVTLTLAAADPNQILAGGNLLNGTNSISVWQLGVYSNTSGWPSGGCYTGGRFWLFGVVKNRFDGSVANDTNPLNFAPTDLYGNVLDDSGCYEYALADDTNTIYWLVPVSENAISVGTKGGEFLIQASNLGDPITATSIQCHRVTKYKCADIEPRWTGLTLAIVQAAQRNILEYMQDPYSRKHMAVNLSENSRHLTGPLIQEIAYQYDLTPIIWARLGDGTLMGITYKRESPLGMNPPKFYGAHHHGLGSGRTILSIQSGPDPNGTYDTLAALTQDPNTQICYVEFLSTTFDETSTIYDANYVDGGGIPTAAQYVTGTPDTVVLEGLNYIIGDTVTVWGAGLDLGDYVVSATGTITLSVGVASTLFTPALLSSISAQGISYGTLGVNVASATGYSANYGLIGLLASTTACVSCPVNWDTNIGIAMHAFTGLQTVNVLTGAAIATLVNSTVNVSANYGAYDANGFVYWTDGGSNSSPIYKQFVSADGTSFGTAIKFGGSSGNFEYIADDLDVVGHMQQPYAMSTGQVYIDKRLRNYMLHTTLVGTASGGARIGLVDTDQMNYTGLSYDTIVDTTTSDTSCRINLSRGITIGVGKKAKECIWYGAAYNYTVGAGGGVDIWRYVVSQALLGGPQFTQQLIATIAPATIASDWTSVDAAAGVAYDETDGNILIGVSTGTGSPAHTAYLLKVGVATGGIIWKLSAGGTSPALNGVGDQHFFQFSRVRGGRLDLIAENSNSFGYTIDTIAGSVLSTTTMTGFGLTGVQVSNGAAGNIIARGNFTDPGAGHFPRPIGATPNFSNEWGFFLGSNGGAPPYGSYYIPFAVGFNYVKQGQILRVIEPQEAGARNGPALGKLRRNHRMALLLANSQGLSIGTLFTDLQPCNFTLYEDGPTIPINTLFSGVYYDTLDDENSFDGMLCWQVSRPYPCNICAVSGNNSTKDQ
jgi:hypothetical protein